MRLPKPSSRSAPTIVQHFPDGDHGFMQRTGAMNEAAIHLSTPQTIAATPRCTAPYIAAPTRS